MDLQLGKKVLDFPQRRKKWVLVLAAFGVTGYGVYRVYHSPSVVKKRKKIFKLLGALISIAEAVSDSAETIGIVAKDLKEFLQSDSDKIPNSLKQISKITRSEEFSESVIGITRAFTVGISRGYRLETRGDRELQSDSSFWDRVMDKLSTLAGSGFASVVVGSFARNLVMAFYSDKQCNGGSNFDSATSGGRLASEASSVPRWVDVVCDEKWKELIGYCIQSFVSTVVAVYLEKTMAVNTYEQFFAGLTNPKHETKVRDILVSVCNGAVETLVKTSRQVLSSSDSTDTSSAGSSFLGRALTIKGHIGRDLLAPDRRAKNCSHESKDSAWTSKMSSTLAVPSNRRLVLDVTGRVTFETIRSFLDFLLEKLSEGLKSSCNVVHEAVIERGLQAFQYVTAKSSVMFTICLSLCLNILGGPWVLVPA